MRIDGEWILSDDGVLRPSLKGRIRSPDGEWHDTVFVVDTGADKSVLCYETYSGIGLECETTDSLAIAGAGGFVESGSVSTDFQFTQESGIKVTFRGPFVGFTRSEALDINLLGRDVLGRFSVIVDRPGNLVCLLTGRHRYTIQES